jgi:transposase
MKKPERIELTQEELDALLERVENEHLQPGDYDLIKAMAETISFLSHAVDTKGVQLKRLLRTLFGSPSEKSVAVFDDSSESEAESADTSSGDGEEETEPGASQSEPEARTKGHGRRAASEYSAAELVTVKYDGLKPGDDCPKCERGTVYEQALAGTIVRVRGTAPFEATVYKLQKLRCSLCGVVLSAEPPAGVGTQKYDESVASLLAVLKYGTGLPFYRLERLQESLGIPLPSSTQWEILERIKGELEPAYDELFRQGAQGEVIHNDDTTVRILELMGKRRERLHDPPERKGLFTTGMISRRENRTIALFFSGSRHAGENLEKLLSLRQAERRAPIQMCDGLAHNEPRGKETIVANCLAHGRRRFLEVLEDFPEEVRHLIDVLAQVYKTDDVARERRLDDDARLELHREESAPLMRELERWLKALFREREVEPNSTLGAAVTYMLKRWDALTLFLRKPGAPLDNNICERGLKKAILNRKNSLFFKTRHGARVGDLFLSLIHTAELCGANPFEYLNALLGNATLVSESASAWMPWNYQAALAQTDTTSATGNALS